MMNSQLKWSILKHFALGNSYGFSSREVIREFPGKNPDYLARILSDMVLDGMLSRTTYQTFHIIPLDEDPRHYEPDGKQVALCFVKDIEYFFGYATAMEILGLSSATENWADEFRQPGADKRETQIYIVTRKRMNPSVKEAGQFTCQFIKHDDARFFGYDSIWINNHEKAMVSDLEKTIVDAFTKPKFSGGILMVGEALYQARDRIDYRKLFHYFARNGQESAKRRYLFLTELLDMEWTDNHNRMMRSLEPGLSKLEPSGPGRGTKCYRFGLIINRDPDSICNRIRPRRIRPEKSTLKTIEPL